MQGRTGDLHLPHTLHMSSKAQSLASTVYAAQEFSSRKAETIEAIEATEAAEAAGEKSVGHLMGSILPKQLSTDSNEMGWSAGGSTGPASKSKAV